MRKKLSVAVLGLVTALLFPSRSTAQIPDQLPAPWQSTDVGEVGSAGNAYRGTDGSLTIAGAGSDIWGAVDSFRFVYQPVRDGTVTAAIGTQTNTDPFAKTGIMLRQSLDPGSPALILDVKPDGGVELMLRATPGGEMTFIEGGSVPVTQTGDQITMDITLSLSRIGDFVNADYCVRTLDRSVFCYGIGPARIPFPTGRALAGVAVTSHDPSRLNEVHLPVMPTVQPFIDEWSAADVGDVGASGEVTVEFGTGTFFVRGAGSDIWGSADSFYAVTQWVNGDSTVTARVVSLQNTDPFAKAGIEAGDTVASAARVVLDVKPDGGIEFMARTETGASMSFLAGARATLPVWLRLVRSGDRFEGLISPDGEAWTTVGSVTMALAITVRIGLAVTSHDPLVTATALFDHIAVVQSPAPHGNLLINPGFESSAIPSLGPGWVSDDLRESPASTSSAAPYAGTIHGACETTTALDCGIYQDLRAPGPGFYAFTVYAAADKPGALIGVNVNGVPQSSPRTVQVGGYARHVIGIAARRGDAIRVWVYSPASAGHVFIDEAMFAIDTGPH